jgi:hypothetical protein
MDNDSLESVYSFAERAYVRLQAGDVLFRCLQESSMSPIQSWVEDLVVDGPQNLETLRAILAEAGERRVQAEADLQELLEEFDANLNHYGVNAPNDLRASTLQRLSQVRLLTMLKEQGILEQETQLSCLRLLKNVRELSGTLIDHSRLLDQIELYLQDWLWGMVYETARQERVDRDGQLAN